MYIPITVLIIIALLVAVLLTSLTVQYKRIFVLLDKLRELMHQKAEVGNFLNNFSRSLKRIEDIDDSMATTARYIADMIEAESTCIYGWADERLKVMGISGAYPLVRGGNSYVMTKPKYIIEMLRRLRIKLNEGLIGQVAARHEPVFIENAHGDPRLSEIRHQRRRGIVA